MYILILSLVTALLAVTEGRTTVPESNMLFMDLVGQQCYMNPLRSHLHFIQNGNMGMTMTEIPYSLIESSRGNKEPYSDSLLPPGQLYSNTDTLYYLEHYSSGLTWDGGFPMATPLTSAVHEIQNYDTGTVTAVFHQDENEQSVDASVCCCKPSFFVLCNTQEFSVPFALHNLFPYISQYYPEFNRDVEETLSLDKPILDMSPSERSLVFTPDNFSYLLKHSKVLNSKRFKTRYQPQPTILSCPIFTMDEHNFDLNSNSSSSDIQVPFGWTSELLTFCTCSSPWNKPISYMFSGRDDHGWAPWEYDLYDYLYYQGIGSFPDPETC